MNEVLKLEHIQKYYGSKGNVTKAIQDIPLCFLSPCYSPSYLPFS